MTDSGLEAGVVGMEPHTTLPFPKQPVTSGVDGCQGEWSLEQHPQAGLYPGSVDASLQSPNSEGS